MTEFDESFARRWLKEIVVWDDRFSVELKSGIVVEIELYFLNMYEPLSAVMVGRGYVMYYQFWG